ARQRLADDLRRPRRAGRADDHFPAVLLLQPQRLFQRVGVRLVQLEAGVLIADPGFLIVDAQLPLARHHLLHTDCYLHLLALGAGASRRCPPAPRLGSLRCARASSLAPLRSLGIWLNDICQSSNLFISSVPLVPPKPKEFESA